MRKGPGGRVGDDVGSGASTGAAGDDDTTGGVGSGTATGAAGDDTTGDVGSGASTGAAGDDTIGGGSGASTGAAGDDTTGVGSGASSGDAGGGSGATPSSGAIIMMAANRSFKRGISLHGGRNGRTDSGPTVGGPTCTTGSSRPGVTGDGVASPAPPAAAASGPGAGPPEPEAAPKPEEEAPPAGERERSRGSNCLSTISWIRWFPASPSPSPVSLPCSSAHPLTYFLYALLADRVSR